MNDEQQALFQKAKESLRAARLLADEEFWDFSVSRAYYAMFYVAEAFLLGEGIAYSKHSAVISAFGQRFAKTGLVSLDFHRYLIDAEDSRHVGDYDIKSKLTSEDAALHIRHAEEFILLAERTL